MLSRIDAHRVAELLLDRLGDVAIAAAVLRAQQAGAAQRYRAMSDWCRIAEAAAAHSAIETGQARSRAAGCRPHRRAPRRDQPRDKEGSYATEHYQAARSPV